MDPFWPKPLPNHWILGSTIGLAVDARNHVFVLHRQSSIDVEFKAAALDPPLGACCVPAPPVLEFAPDGTLVNSWGGPGQGYDWPLREHGLSIDHKGNVWIGGNDDKDSQILKFTSAGRFVLQIGRPGQKKGSNDTENFWRPAKSLRRGSGERSLHCGRLRQPPGHRRRCGQRQAQASLGRIWRSGRTTG